MSRSLPVVRAFGLGLGVVLGATLVAAVAIDHSVHVASAGHAGLGPWLVTVAAGLLVFACYWAGLAYLLRRLREFSGAEHQFETVFERNPLAAWVFDTGSLRFLEVNQAARDEYGYSREEFLAMTILDVRPSHERAKVLEEVSTTPRPAHDAEVWLHQRKDGSTLEVRIHGAEMQFHGRQARLIVAENVTEKLAIDRELSHRATHKLSTGLWNSSAFTRTLREWGTPTCRIACLQIHGLDLIEDSLGPAAGESALKAIAGRMAELGRRYGAVAHLRDTEFAFAVSRPERWTKALAALREALAQPVESADGTHRFDAWIGTADMPADGPDPSQVLALARVAAHVARAEGIPVAAYQPAMAQEAGRRLALIARIRHAIEHGEFTLAYQPIHRISDGSVAGLEALLRWPQADGSLVSPLEFIPLCEDTGLIVPLGQWVLREAAKTAASLAGAGFGPLPVAVNVSHAQLAGSDFAGEVTRLFDEFGLARGALHVELTESVLMTRPDHALEVLRSLHGHGICISLDDFGTGFSSMSYLRQLPIDALKIDRSFVQDVERDPHNASICRALIALGQGLGLQVVAEGVERPAQYDWLRRHGCDQAQGFGLARPAPLDEVLAAIGCGRRDAGAA
jgi:PAS domain S-box-containing protein